MQQQHLLITTAEHIVGREVRETLGLVEGSTIHTRHLGSHIVAVLTMLIGGEMKGYSRAIHAARKEAKARMVEEARVLGADAIVSMRFSTSQIVNGGAEVLAYGTAVTLR